MNVGLLSPGDMGHVVGKVMIDNGATVLTCLSGRSDRTKSLAEAAGIGGTDSYEDLVNKVDLLLSIMVPSESPIAVAAVAEAVRATDEDLVYVDCNAIAPATAKKMDKTIRDAGARFVDAGIIGGPPRKPGGTRFYASGKDAAEFEKLRDFGLDVRVIGEEIGQASGIKMCYAALTKGTSALMIELLTAANRMGLYDSLIGELEMSQQDRLQMMQGLVNVPSRSRRWIGEMLEIAETFDDLGMTPKIYEGASAMFDFVGGTALADETPETRDKNRTLQQLIEHLAKA